jgi:hypothetical protein
MKAAIKKLTSGLFMLVLTFGGVGLLASSIVVMTVELIVSSILLPGVVREKGTFNKRLITAQKVAPTVRSSL